MNYYTTIIRAIDPVTGKLKTWDGPNIYALSYNLAVQYCNDNGLGYCKVDGILVSEISTKKDGVTPDMGSRIDYNKIQLN